MDVSQPLLTLNLLGLGQQDTFKDVTLNSDTPNSLFISQENSGQVNEVSNEVMTVLVLGDGYLFWARKSTMWREFLSPIRTARWSTVSPGSCRNKHTDSLRWTSQFTVTDR